MSTTSVRYSVPATAQGITVTTELDAPSYTQTTAHSFLKSVKARDFARGLYTPNLTAWIVAALGLPNPISGIVAAVYTLYLDQIASQIDALSDQYPGVYIKVINAGVFGQSYVVQGWSDTTTAVVYLTNSDTASENVTGVYTC